MPRNPVPIVDERLPKSPNCERCSLHESTRNVCAPGIGPKHAEILILGESPGGADARTGVPFSSGAGQLLRNELSKVGIDVDRCFVTNSVGCRPPDGRSPTNPELKACRPYVSEEIERINPKFVLLLGATALKYIKKKGITEIRGSVLEVDGRIYFPIFHPAAILRDPGKQAGFSADIAKFKRLVDGTLEDPKSIPYQFITPLTVKTFLQEFRDSPSYSFDIETTGLMQQSDDFRVNSIGIAFDNLSTWVLPLSLNGDPNWASKVLQDAYRLSKGKTGIAWNGKFDNNGLFSQYGFRFHLNFDGMLASHIFDENAPHDLKYEAKVKCGAPDYDDLTLKQKLDPVGQNCLPKFYQYQADDAYWTMSLYHYYQARFRETYKLRRLFYKLVMPCARMFEGVDYGGHFINLEKFEAARKLLTERIAKNSKELDALARAEGIRRKINWGSPKQVAEVLYDRIGLPVTEKTPTGAPSTGESALLQLEGMHEIPDKLIEWRGNNKFLNTYIEGWEELMIGPMLYLSTKLHGTVTGRYSSRLHQTPRDTLIRGLMDAPPGWVFVCADFSQIELRLVAHIAQEPTMMRIFNENGDIHIETAKEVMMTTEEPTKEQRKAAKGVNFGYVYGMWWKKFKKYAKEKYGVELTDNESREFRERYFMKYTGLTPWHDAMRWIVRDQGYVEYLSGRLRRLPGVYSADKDARQEAERQAINSPVQGFGSGDLKAMAMIEIYETFRKDVVQVKGEVHDSILMWIKEEALFDVMPQVKHIMEHPKLFKTFNITLDVPLIADVEFGTWGSGTKYELGMTSS